MKKIEELKECVTKVIDTLTQEYFHGAWQKLLERYNKCMYILAIPPEYDKSNTGIRTYPEENM